MVCVLCSVWAKSRLHTQTFYLCHWPFDFAPFFLLQWLFYTHFNAFGGILFIYFSSFLMMRGGIEIHLILIWDEIIILKLELQMKLRHLKIYRHKIIKYFKLF